jgi:hypothetical protein
MNKRSKRLTAVVTLTLGIAFVTKAGATITFLPGNNPQPGEENILFGAKETGTTINGATNTSDIGIQFTSSETFSRILLGKLRSSTMRAAISMISLSLHPATRSPTSLSI